MKLSKQTRRQRFLQLEPLEPRMVLSGSGLVPIGTQPQGALSGKIVYTHAGHGWTANNLGSGAWSTQRPELFEMVEDMGNQDQITFFADYLFRAGATVVPIRPVGTQTNEVVLDNDDPGVTFSGAWSDSSGSVYFGDPGDVPYRFVAASTTETATARYQPNIPEAGHYPVYAWTKLGTNRASDQLYRIAHTGGITEVTINHRRVGDGPVYLGTYYFAAGNDGYVEISNRSNDANAFIVADMIRFGNGMGDIDRGGGISGQSRADEAGLYWVKWHVDNSQGIPDSEYRTLSDDRDATVSLSPRYAEFMNNAGDGSLSDRVFVSFHSNAGGGRGVIGLVNGNNSASSATPNQANLAFKLAKEVNDDLVSQNGDFEHNWLNRTSLLYDAPTFEFGEINNVYINNEFDATIIETGFHDNQMDAELIRDPKVRDAIARATYQGLVKYFNDVDGGATPLIMAPAQPTFPRAESVAADSVRLTWRVPNNNSFVGDAPTGYRIYSSFDGYGFDGGTFVAGGSTTSFTFTGLNPGDGMHYFKVVAVNDGGESPATEVVAARPGASSERLLIVNGFDRFDRTLNRREPYFAGTIDRVQPRFSNSFDYAAQVGDAIEAYSNSIVVDTTSNDAVISAEVSLLGYDAVIWILGEESTADSTFDSNEQFWVSTYLSLGGKLFVSGAETGWDLDNLGNGQSFYENELRANYVADDANTYNVQGAAGSIFAGLNFSFDNGSTYYDAQFPDVISASSGSTIAMNYVGGSGGGAAVTYEDGSGMGRIVNFGFPFETITSAADRAAVMERVLMFFGLGATTIDGDFDDNGLYECFDVDSLVAAIVDATTNPPDLTFDLNGDGNLTMADLDAWLAEAGNIGGLTSNGNPVLHGDADLNGTVDGADFLAWNDNKFTQTAAWCSGDFTADGFVDAQDFVLWNDNKFTSALRLSQVEQQVPLRNTNATPPIDIASRVRPLPNALTVHQTKAVSTTRSASAAGDSDDDAEESHAFRPADSVAEWLRDA